MKKLIMIIVITISIFTLTDKSKAQLGYFDYSLYFYQSPIETIYNGYPAMKFLINYGGFTYRPCQYCECTPPPMEFIIEVWWQNPNDPGGDPNCWLLVYEGLVHYDFGAEIFAQRTGRGLINLVNPIPTREIDAVIIA